MTFVKFMFALFFLVPVAILMWYLISKLINEFTDSVKKSREQERARENALKDQERKRSADQLRYGDRRPVPYAGYSGDIHQEHRIKTRGEDHQGAEIALSDEKKQTASGLKRRKEKRKRRKERRKKKDKE